MFNKKNSFINIPCPNCGTIHQIHNSTNTQYYLDGVPNKNIDTIMQDFCICSNCGCVYKQNLTYVCHPSSIVQSNKYLDILKDDSCDLTYKKIQLLQLLRGSIHENLLLIHYYHDKNKNEQEKSALLDLIKILQTHHGFMKSYSSKQFPQIALKRGIDLGNEELLIDVYRRAKLFQQAQTQINDMRSKYPWMNCNTETYLAHQERLIADKNSNLI